MMRYLAAAGLLVSVGCGARTALDLAEGAPPDSGCAGGCIDASEIDASVDTGAIDASVDAATIDAAIDDVAPRDSSGVEGGPTGPLASCLAILDAYPDDVSGTYLIDPDGPDNGLSPFTVYCDMTTAGGGWTFLPLRFGDPSYWSITQPGNTCIVVDITDDSGNYRQYFSSQTGDYSTSFLQFVPPIPLTTVRFVNFMHINGGSQNTMDFAVGALPSSVGLTWQEGWYFADGSLSAAGADLEGIRHRPSCDRA